MKQEIKSALQVKLVSWPTPQDYNEALQNPQISFSDPELKKGTPALTALGLPKPMTGSFASVYRMHCKDRDWAVRCFLRNFPDQHERYTKIEDHIVAAKLPFTVGFDYIEDGLNLHGERYPILKMEWAEGQHLDQFIAHNLHNPKLLNETADAWKEMLCKLRQGGIAHGDLQHGNVLVDNKTFELVDYDGMYVPALEGMGSNELGHRNYQHPGRTKDHFGLYLDNFPGWLIYATLKILSLDPNLWTDLQGGDECLLFRQQDLKDPMHSVAFSLLEHHKSPEIQQWSKLLRSFLHKKVEDVPNLESNPVAPTNLPEIPKWTDLLAEKAEAAPKHSDPNRLPSWMTDASHLNNATHMSSPTGQAQSKKATWPPPKGTFGQTYYQSQSSSQSPYSKPATWPPPKYSSSSQKSAWSSIRDFMNYWNLGVGDMLVALVLAIIWIPTLLAGFFSYLATTLAPLLTAIGWEWSWPLWTYAFAAVPIGLYYAIRYWPKSASTTPAPFSQGSVLGGLILVLLLAFFIFVTAAGQFHTSLKNTTNVVGETQQQTREHNDAVATESESVADALKGAGDYNEAIVLYKRALSQYVANYQSEPATYLLKITKTLNTIGECYQKIHSPITAKRYFDKSAELVLMYNAHNLTKDDLYLLPW